MKQKLNEIKEKGKKWFEDHKFTIGCVAGTMASLACACVAAKVFEPKSLGTAVSHDTEVDDKNFCIGVYGVDRFGNTRYLSPWVRYETNAEDHRNEIVDAIDNHMNKSKVINF